MDDLYNSEEVQEEVTPESSAYEEYLEKYGLAPEKNGDYVDKEEFYNHMKAYADKRDAKYAEMMQLFDAECEECRKLHKKLPKLTDEYWENLWKEIKPPVDDFIAIAIMKIATHLSYRPNFNGYTYRSEFIGDAIENCIRYIDNFDCNKSHNPFAYCTTVCWYSFVRRLVLEKNQSEIKGKLMMQNLNTDFMSMCDEDDMMNLDETIRNTHAFVELAHQRNIKEEEERARKKEEKEKRKQEKLEKNSLKDFFA